jgi:hypothetical protein
MTTLAQCTYINADKEVIFGEDPEPEETWTDELGALFRDAMHEYGRCTSKIYIDTKRGTEAIGWVFRGRQKYEDTRESYIREVWMTLFERCEPGDPRELTRNGRETGLRYRVIGKG